MKEGGGVDERSHVAASAGLGAGIGGSDEVVGRRVLEPSPLELHARPGEQRLVELSHLIEPGMITVPGLPGPEITPHLTRTASRAHYAPGTEFAIDRITMVGNTGTYLDTPFHRYARGYDLGALPLERIAHLPAVVIRTAGCGLRAVGVDAMSSVDVSGKAVLLHTGGDRGFGTSAYAESAPFLTAEGADWLVEHEAALVGIDSVNIDDLDDPERPAHTILLAAEIPIVEHLTGLGQLPVRGARFTGAPPRVARYGTFPVRAFAVVGP
jgi:kynurenine formamidase